MLNMACKVTVPPSLATYVYAAASSMLAVSLQQTRLDLKHQMPSAILLVHFFELDTWNVRESSRRTAFLSWMDL